MPQRYDPYNLDSLLNELNKPPVTTDLMPQREGFESMWEALGQTAWGFASGGLWGVPEIWDMSEEAATKGEKANRVEEWVTSLPKEIFTLGKTEDNYAGDFSASERDRELGSWGKIGYSVGNVAGMILSFGWLGKGTSIGVKTGTKIKGVAGSKLGWGTTAAEKAHKVAQDDVLESIGQIVYKAGQKEGAYEFGKDEAAKIAKDSLEIISTASARGQGARMWGDAAFQVGARQSIKEEVLKPIVGVMDENLLDDYAKEVFEVMMRRTPDDARNIITNAALELVRKSSGKESLSELSRAQRIGASLASATAYESLIGLTLGAVRGSAEYAIGQHFDWKGQKERTPESFLHHVLGVAGHEAVIFSAFGPLKYIKGGSRLSLWNKTKDMTRGLVNQLKPIKKMSTKEMSANVELLHTLSKDGVLGKLDFKWSGRESGWWRNIDKITSKRARKEKEKDLVDFITEARSKFLKDAPGLFARELGADITKSLPRMATGVAVMNLTSLKDAYKAYGWDGIMAGFGETDYEKFANIMTAAYFTRQPHSFHLPGTPYKGPFESGAIKNFSTKRAKDYAEAVTGLNLIGAKNYQSALRVANQYGGFSDTNPKSMEDKLYNKSFEGSEEVQRIKEVIDPHSAQNYKVPVGEEAAGDITTAGYKFIAELPDPAIKAEWRDKLSIAKGILKWHDANSHRTQVLSPVLTKNAAKNLIEQLSSIKFDGKRLNAKEPETQLTNWYASRVQREGDVALGIVKDYVIESYRALGVDASVIDGKITVPRLDANLHGEFMRTKSEEDGSRDSAAEVFVSLHTAVKNLEKIGIVRFTNEVHDTASLKMIDQAVKVKEGTVDQMMEYVHGDAKVNKIVDEAIIRNPVWYITHNRMQEIAQRNNTEYVLKGSGETGLDKVNADKLSKDLKNELSGEKFPDIESANKELMTETEISLSNVEGLGDAVTEMKRVHRLISLTTPEHNIGAPRTIKAERLVELHNQWKRMLGNVVTDPDVYQRTQKYLIEKGVVDLGIQGLDGGYNMHAAIHELAISKPFNTETGIRIPKLEQVNDMVDALGSKVTKETKKDVKKYYAKVIGLLNRSGVGSIKISDMTEQFQGEWYEAIRSSMVLGRGTASRFAHDRILEVMRHAEDTMDNFDHLGAEMSISAAKDAANRGQEKELIDFFAIKKDQTKMLIDQLKRGIESGDGLIVHAYADRVERINELLDLAVEAARDPLSGRHQDYMAKILKQIQEARSDAAADGWTEANVKETAVKIMDQMNVPEKDRLDIGIKISASQFSQKYDIGMQQLTDMFLSYRSMDRTVKKASEGILDMIAAIDLNATYNNKPLYSDQVKNQVNKTKRHVSNILAKGGAPDPNMFWEHIVKPLMDVVNIRSIDRFKHLENGTPLEGWEKFNNNLINDIHSMTSSYFSSMPVKHYTFRSGQLFVQEKQLGYTEKYGAQGVINALNNSTEISVLSNAFYIDGNYVSKPSELQMKRIIQTLEAGVPVSYENGFRQYLGDASKVKEHDIAQGKQTETLNTQKFTVVSADESTLLLVRLSDGERIQKDLLTGFQKSGLDSNNNRVKGGHLFERLQASLNVNPRTGEAIYPHEIRDVVDRINLGEMTTNDIRDAINLTRILNDRPSLIYRWAELTPEQKKSAWKYLKLSELKGGFVGHDENLARIRSFIEGASKEDKSGFYENILNSVRKFLPEDKSKPFPKLKLVSVADEMVHENGKINIFSAIDYQKAEFERLFNDQLINKTTFDQNIANLEKVTNSVVDGATSVSKDAYISSLAMMGGVTPEMIKFHPDGTIKEIKIGGIKPTISHSDVKTDLADMSQYGRVKEFYAKTAFHYDPIFDGLLHNLGIDGIIFNSSNKVNEFRHKQDQEWYNTDVTKMEWAVANNKKSVHAMFPGLDKPSDLPTDYNSRAMWLGQNIQYEPHHIHHIPFDAINLKSLGVPHDPLVGSNLSVHMHDHVGIKEWIGLDAKISKVYDAFDRSIDPYYATKLAKELFSHSAESGDMAWMNTGMDHFLKHNGLLTSPWQRTMIEEKIIPYFMNNGMIAAGRVDHGSLDVMSPDLGGLKTSIIRKHRDDTKGVQFFGEFVQSKHSALKPFKRGGEGKNADVRSAFIQRVEFRGISHDTSQGEVRHADVFFIEREGMKLMVVEGLYIDADGNRRSLYDNKTIPYFLTRKASNQGEVNFVRARNKLAYKDALAREDTFFESIGDGKDMNYSEVMTKLYEYDQANPGFDMALGSLSNRQPRNQVGDVVIARLHARKRGDGTIATHNGDLRGNSSRMNHMDAISPQDADYDMDKSSVFLAAPNNLWAEASRLGGYRVYNDVDLLGKAWDTIFSKENPEMFTWQGDPQKYKLELNATDMQRGRFVKLHQSLSYFHNIFRDNPTLIHLRSPFKAHDNIEVRFNPSELAYFNTVEKVTQNVKLFLDLYKRNPKHYTENPDELIKEIIFGYEYGNVKHKGLFELYDSETQQRIQDKTILQGGDKMKRVRDDIYYNLLSPLNQYLRFNKGTVTDETNRDVSATLNDYQRGYQQLLYAIQPHKRNRNYQTKGKAGMVTYDNSPMFSSTNKYIEKSSSPFDVAMRGLSKYVNHGHGLEEMRIGSREILDYINDGRITDDILLRKPKDYTDVQWSELQHELVLNRVANKAIRQLADKTGEIVRLEQFATHINRIDAKLDYLDGIAGRGKDPKARLEYQKLQEQKLRLTELKSIVEENLSYNPNNADNKTVFNPAQRPTKKGKSRNVKPGDYTRERWESKPVVVVNKQGQTKEVILPGRKNYRQIHWSDTIVENGHRYEVVDGNTQAGLRSEFRAYGGLPHFVTNKKNGETIRLQPGETIHIDNAYKRIIETLNDLYGSVDKTKPSIEEYAAKKTALILDTLEHPDFAFKPEKQLALIFRMLRPNWDSKVSPIFPIRYTNQSKTAVIGNVKFRENRLAKSAWNTLSQIANGSVDQLRINSKGGIDKAMATEMLRDLVNLQHMYYVEETKGIKVDMNKLGKIGYTEPTSLPDGYMTDAKFLDKRIFEQMRDGNANQSRAAGILYKYLSGQAFVDPATLYKASKEMEAGSNGKPGIPINEQFMMKVYDPATDKYKNATLRNFGIMDAYRSMDRGQGGVMRENGSKTIREIFGCLNITGS